MNNKNKNKQYCLLDTNVSYIYNLGFRYSSYYECHIYVFPVAHYKKIPTVFCRLRLYKLDNIIEYDIIKPNKSFASFYYDRNYGNAKNYIKYIDNKIYKRMKAMGIKRKK